MRRRIKNDFNVCIGFIRALPLAFSAKNLFSVKLSPFDFARRVFFGTTARWGKGGGTALKFAAERRRRRILILARKPACARKGSVFKIEEI